MRYFPDASRRRVGSRFVHAALAAVLAAGLMALPTAGADNLKDKRDKVEKKIDDAEENLHASSKGARRANARLERAQEKLAIAQGQLARAESQVATARVEDQKMQDALATAEAELQRAEAALKAGQAEAKVAQTEVAAKISDFYQQGDPSLLAFASLMEAATPADLARQSEMQQAILDKDANNYQELVAVRVMLDVQRGQVEDARDEVKRKRELAAMHLETMKGLEADAQDVRDQVAGLVKESQSAAEEAEKNRRADEAALRELKAEENRIAELLRQRALAQSAASVPKDSSGVLQWPVTNARLSSPYGFRKHPIYGYWGMHDGQDWAAGCGTPLYATENGTILQSYFSTVYGNRLVLDHGKLAGVGLASIYNHATHYVVRVGQQVKRGQVIGYVGSTGWSTGCHLHFTVMVNGQTADPVNWL